MNMNTNSYNLEFSSSYTNPYLIINNHFSTSFSKIKNYKLIIIKCKLTYSRLVCMHTYASHSKSEEHSCYIYVYIYIYIYIYVYVLLWLILYCNQP